jgi:hypothetical protein
MPRPSRKAAIDHPARFKDTPFSRLAVMSARPRSLGKRNPKSIKKETTMNKIGTTAEIKDKRVILSTLWLFAVLNYIYADVMTLMYPELLRKFISGYLGAIQITQDFMLGAAILMETAMVMVPLSRFLNYRANRWANIIVGAFHTAVVFASMFAGAPVLHLVFYAIIEIVCTAGIVWYAWKWHNLEDQS